ncbi:hypothetical protein L249_8225 [Ophiocordyceps polyrhachis-furcata BCC 54312]|uniref:Cytochrome c oxidase polypeptide VIa n=1 Tax=Ophiocordyceps polyrhachis-furcata BCC 54312 TaxID=1330021 RepID=A0A367LHK1_9HYPO|nr:hypothetical protein L249_8225 [Ophiocordyceps polyrhachis-furcata BCC 54312]
MITARATSRFAAQVRNLSQRRLASSTASTSATPAAENKFIKERQHIKAHAERTESAVIPALALGGANAYYLWNQHWEHWSHKPPLEERVEYPYQNIRTKNFMWGDGDKEKPCSWNTKVNYHNKDKVA